MFVFVMILIHIAWNFTSLFHASRPRKRNSYTYSSLISVIIENESDHCVKLLTRKHSEDGRRGSHSLGAHDLGFSFIWMTECLFASGRLVSKGLRLRNLAAIFNF